MGQVAIHQQNKFWTNASGWVVFLTLTFLCQNQQKTRRRWLHSHGPEAGWKYIVIGARWAPCTVRDPQALWRGCEGYPGLHWSRMGGTPCHWEGCFMSPWWPPQAGQGSLPILCPEAPAELPAALTPLTAQGRLHRKALLLLSCAGYK